MRRYNPIPGLLSLPEAAERLGVSVYYVRYLVNVGDIPVQSIGKRYVVSVPDVDAWGERRTARRAWQTIHNAEKQAAR